jgi:hypothetical protein
MPKSNIVVAKLFLKELDLRRDLRPEERPKT